MWNLQTGDVAFKHCSMQNLADHFNFTGTILYNLNLPVVERTGLDGFFDFTLSYPAREFMADKDGVLIFAALRKLGLDGENSCSGPRRGAVGELKASLHRKHWGSR